MSEVRVATWLNPAVIGTKISLSLGLDDPTDDYRVASPS
jgi:hypothetical protein